eukprot:TRINITY_DN18449_c0_g1_i1.p1 TRINITY_DN18449_c0_g1~~TRINITY_DN18449_c0_g1_i1.p1  ORF type:complete len:303 (+),score=69.89 TRINITY_DN18449_c0_g1_i1:72-980(+)
MATLKRCGRLLFLGSGSSIGTPSLRCAMQREEKSCPVCEKALADPNCKDARGTPCVLVETPDGGRVVVDCGPSFKQNALRFFPQHGVASVEALLLTHDHFDALGAVNEMREVQAARNPPGVWRIDTTMPVYGNAKALATARRMFPYLFAGEFETVVGKFDAVEITHNTPFTPPGIGPYPILPLEVEHGRDYLSFAYAFGSAEDRVVYISDVSRVPDDTMALLTATPIATLIVDAVADFERPSHFSVKQALALVNELRPGRALLTGISCHLDHAVTNTALEARTDLVCPVELAYDGMCLEFSW